MLNHLLQDTSAQKALGAISSATIAILSPMIAQIPIWAGHIRDWAALAAAVGGGLGALLYAWSLALDIGRKRREEREAHKKEIKDLEDEMCRKRRAIGACPLMEECKKPQQ